MPPRGRQKAVAVKVVPIVKTVALKVKPATKKSRTAVLTRVDAAEGEDVAEADGEDTAPENYVATLEELDVNSLCYRPSGQPARRPWPEVVKTIRNPPAYWLDLAKAWIARPWEKVNKDGKPDESTKARKIRTAKPLWRDFVADWRGDRGASTMTCYLPRTAYLFEAFHPQTATGVHLLMANDKNLPKCEVQIESWDWLGLTDNDHLLVVAYALERVSGLEISSVTALFQSFQAASWSVPALRKSFLQFQSYAFAFGKVRAKKTAEQTFTAKERQEYATPLEFDRNGRLLEAETLIAGTDASRFAQMGKAKLNRFKRMWQNYAMYRMITNGDFVLRPQSFYNVLVVKSEAEAQKHSAANAGLHNYFVFTTDESKPLTIIMNDWKTKDAKANKEPGMVPGPRNLVFTSTYVTKAVRDSFIAFPRKWLMQQSTGEQSLNATQVSGSACIEWVLQPDRTDAQRPTFNTIRSSYTTNFFNQNAGNVPREVWSRQSLSSLAEMSNSYFKAGEPELLARMKADYPKMMHERKLYEGKPSAVDMKQMAKSAWLIEGPVLRYEYAAVPKISKYDNTVYMNQYRNDKVVLEETEGSNPVYRIGTRDIYLKAKRKYQAGGGARMALVHYLNKGLRKNKTRRRPYGKSVTKYQILWDDATFKYV